MDMASVPTTLAADALSSLLAAFFPDHLLDMGPGWKQFRAEVHVHPLAKSHLVHARFSGPLKLHLPHARQFMQGFPIRGGAETVNNGVVTVSSVGDGAVAEPGEVTFSTLQAFENLTLIMEPEALLRVIATLTGTCANAPLKLDRPLVRAPREQRIANRLVGLMHEELLTGDAGPSPLAMAELEQALLVAFVCGTRHNYSHRLRGETPDAAPWQVRRVEDYVAANWDQPISIEALAVVANSSVRSIFNTFKTHRGYTPMAFVRKVRFEHAKRMLQTPSADMSVTTAAFACGFGNLGHFARDYERAFGEKPSTTLRRAGGR